MAFTRINKCSGGSLNQLIVKFAGSLALVLVILFGLLLTSSSSSQTSVLATNAGASQTNGNLQANSGGANYNNFDNLISEFLDDAGNRLKKSKLNSMRQIKPTLRFGRRSDPLMAPSLADQLAMLESQNEYEAAQRRALANALANAEN